MTCKEYACVFYIEDECYSSVKAEKIAYITTEFPTVQATIGSELLVVWEDTGKEHKAKIIAIGKKSKMSRMAAALAKEASDKSFCENEANGNKRKSRTCQGSDEQTEQEQTHPIPSTSKKSKAVHQGASNVIQELQMRQKQLVCLDVDDENSSTKSCEYGLLPMGTGESSTGMANIIAAKDKEIDELRRQLLRERTKLLNIQKTRFVDQAELQEFDNGLTIPKGLVASIRDRYRGSPPQFLRAMMEQTGVFTLEEISQHSVYGHKTAQSPNEVRPALPAKFIALKKYVIEECGLVAGTASFMKFEASVRGICSDARKRFKLLNKPKAILS